MPCEFAYRGRQVSATEIEFIRQLIAAHPALSRRRLSAKLGAAWNWVQANGRPRDRVARSLMLEWHRAGHIQLGLTAGLGKDATSRVPHRSFKQLWVYALRPDFRRQLVADAFRSQDGENSQLVGSQ